MKRVKRCYMTNCFAVAPFASPANPDVHACEEHKKRDFVNMRNKRCLAPGCYRNPHYGVSRAVNPNSKAQYCTEHKSPGMENVNGGRCAGPGCTKQPRFALPGSKGKFCSKHREAGMVDVLYTPCATEGCAKHPHFGFADGGPRYCAQHRAEGMVDVKHRRCAVKGCRRDRLQLMGGPRKRGKFCEVHCAESDLSPGEQSRIEQQAKKTAPTCTYESGDQNKRKRDADDTVSPGDMRAEAGGVSPAHFPLPVEPGSEAQAPSATIRGEEMAHLRDKMSSAPEATACPSHATEPLRTVLLTPWKRKGVMCPSQADDCQRARLAPAAPVVQKKALDPRTAWLEEPSGDGLPPFCKSSARRLGRTDGKEHDRYQGEGISSFGVVHHRAYSYPYPLFHLSSEVSKYVMPTSSCENPPNARRRVRQDQLKPFRLRCWQPSSDQPEEPWYPFPWEILRDKWSLASQETATMRGRYMVEGEASSRKQAYDTCGQSLLHFATPEPSRVTVSAPRQLPKIVEEVIDATKC